MVSAGAVTACNSETARQSLAWIEADLPLDLLDIGAIDETYHRDKEKTLALQRFGVLCRRKR